MLLSDKDDARVFTGLNGRVYDALVIRFYFYDGGICRGESCFVCCGSDESD